MSNAQAGTARTGVAASHLAMILGAVLVAALAGAALGALMFAPPAAGTDNAVAAQTVGDSSYEQVEQLRVTRTSAERRDRHQLRRHREAAGCSSRGLTTCASLEGVGTQIQRPVRPAAPGVDGVSRQGRVRGSAGVVIPLAYWRQSRSS